MPLFPGPIEQANQQWLRNVSLGSKTTRFAPTQEDTARIREEVEVQKARNFLASGVVQNQLQQQRQQLVDQGILQNRTNNPPTPQVLNQRATPRLTIEEINRLSADDIRTQIEKMGQNQMGDQRSSGMKFLDLIDLPRNSVFNLAFTDEIGVKEVGGVGAGIGMAGLAGAAIGGVIGGIGGLFAGGVTAIPGAIAGAKTGAMVGSGLYTVPLTLASGVGSFLDEEDKESIRKESMEENAGTLGLPRIYFSQVLDRLGMEEGAKRTALGLVGDIVLDPLSWQMRPQANIWTSGARVQGHAVRVSNAGLKNVRHFSEALVKEGAVDATTGLIKVGKNSPFKPLEKLWNQSVIIGDQAHKIHPGMNFGKRATDAKKH